MDNNQKKEIGQVSIPAGEYFKLEEMGLPTIFSSKEKWDAFLEKNKKEMEEFIILKHKEETKKERETNNA